MSSSSAIEGNEIVQRETIDNENVSAQGVRTRSSYQAVAESAALAAQDRSRGRQSSRTARSRSRSAGKEAARVESKSSPKPSLNEVSDRVAVDATAADEEEEELERNATALAQARVATILREKERANRLARRVEELVAAQLAAADEARRADEEVEAQRAAEMAMELQRRAAQAEQDEYEQQARAAERERMQRIAEREREREALMSAREQELAFREQRLAAREAATAAVFGEGDDLSLHSLNTRLSPPLASVEGEGGSEAHHASPSSPERLAGATAVSLARGGGIKFTLQVDAIKVYLAKQTGLEKAATAARLPQFTESVANYGLDKFSDFSESLMTSLRLVNQEKIILGLETVKSYYTGCDLLVLNSESNPLIARTITTQEREFLHLN